MSLAIATLLLFALFAFLTRRVAKDVAAARMHREALDAMAERLRQPALFEAALRALPIALPVIDKDLRHTA